MSIQELERKRERDHLLQWVASHVASAQRRGLYCTIRVDIEAGVVKLIRTETKDVPPPLDKVS